MALEEVKQYQAVCDNCGRAGDLWTQLRESERQKAIPEGWRVYLLNGWYEMVGRKRIPGNTDRVIICDTCLASVDDIDIPLKPDEE